MKRFCIRLLLMKSLSVYELHFLEVEYFGNTYMGLSIGILPVKWKPDIHREIQEALSGHWHCTRCNKKKLIIYKKNKHILLVKV